MAHLGVGSNVLPGFENIDFYFIKPRENVIGHDFRFRFPFVDGAFEGALSEHTLEHMSPDEGMDFLREVNRIIRSGGIFRVSVPDLRLYVRYYLGEAIDPEFKQFKTGCEAMHSLTQKWDHLTCWDADTLIDALLKAGFSSATEVSFRVGQDPRLLVDQEGRRWESLYVEAIAA